jgi:hypothetical protein
MFPHRWSPHFAERVPVVRRLIENQNITADFALPIARPLRVKFRTR